jgi:hypothetical protein
MFEENTEYKYVNIPFDFDSNIYIELNDDLSNMTKIEAKKHYEFTGFQENRKYKYVNIPFDFDSNIYIELNDDLSNMTKIEAKKHYEFTGFLEYRKYKYNLNFNVYIYCCGKSGSSTLTSTFNKNGFNAIQLHSSKFYKNKCIESKLNPNIFDVIEKSMENNENVYVIDSYRMPIEKKISGFFQHYKASNTDIEYITELIDNKIYFSEDYVAINEILDYFNIPYFNTFDFEKKYNLIKYKNINIIKLRFEDINEWGSILSTIFNKKITMYDENISKNKSYFNVYKTIKNTYNIPDFMIDIIQNNTEFKIYNTLESQKQYIEYWSSRCKPFIFKNIPNDFNAKSYI